MLGVPGKNKRKKGRKKTFEELAENFTIYWEILIYTPKKLNKLKVEQIHTLWSQCFRNKEKISAAAREK